MSKLRYFVLGALCIIVTFLVAGGSRIIPVGGAGGTVTPIAEVASTATTSTTASSVTTTATSSLNAPLKNPLSLSTTTITVGGTLVHIELATSTTAVERGLSGRISLATQNGMLFIFDIPAIYKFWMPDMNFPLDMIWIGSNGKVVDISANVPDTFNPAKPIYYTPKTPAEYVLEVNAGFAARNGITIGSAVSLSNVQ